MDANSKDNEKITIDAYFNTLIRDDRNILFALSKLSIQPEDTVEIISEIPARLDIDLIVSLVQRWKEILKIYKCKLRVYAWVYRDDVEKYLLSLTQNCDNILITPMPYTLRELNKNERHTW